MQTTRVISSDLYYVVAQLVHVPGMIELGPDGSTLLMDTNYMYELEHHIFLLVARRDTRYVIAYQDMELATGDPPRANIL